MSTVTGSGILGALGFWIGFDGATCCACCLERWAEESGGSTRRRRLRRRRSAAASSGVLKERWRKVMKEGGERWWRLAKF